MAGNARTSQTSSASGPIIRARSSLVSEDWKMAEALATPPTWPTFVCLSCKINDDKMALLLVYLGPGIID